MNKRPTLGIPPIPCLLIDVHDCLAVRVDILRQRLNQELFRTRVLRVPSAAEVEVNLERSDVLGDVLSARLAVTRFCMHTLLCLNLQTRSHVDQGYSYLELAILRNYCCISSAKDFVVGRQCAVSSLHRLKPFYAVPAISAACNGARSLLRAQHLGHCRY